MAVSGRLALVAALGALVVGVLAPSWTGVVGIVAALGVGVAVDLLRAGRGGPLRMLRDTPGPVRLGESVEVTLTVENPGSRAVHGRLRDAWPPSAGATPPRHRLDVPPGERRRLVTTLTPTRRGERWADRITVRSWGPLGLAARQRSVRVSGTVTVLPRFASRRHLASRLARMRELDGRRAIQVRAAGTEFDSLREYVPGDDVRSLDWRASARSTGLVVRTWRPERDRHVLVVLDTGRTAAARVGDDEATGTAGAPRLDASMDAALLLGALASRGGDRVDLLAVDRVVRASVVGVHELLPALVQAMAPLEAQLVETDMRLLTTTVLTRAPRRSLVVLFTALEDAAVREGLEPALGALLHRHTVLVAAVDDPALTALAAGRADAEAVYGAAAAQVAQDERRRVSERLARRGVEVVTAGPDDIAPAVADRYLALKAAGRL